MLNLVVFETEEELHWSKLCFPGWKTLLYSSSRIRAVLYLLFLIMVIIYKTEM